MTYIYDIILNFTDDDYILEFYEWQEKDNIEQIKQIPVFRISTTNMNNLINNKIVVEKELLNNIKDKTITYNGNSILKYCCLFTDLNKIMALEFNQVGEVISKSGLLLDEEDEVIGECITLQEQEIVYEIKEKYSEIQFLTRNEKFKRRYLITEINNTYKEKNIDKLNYLYQELYKKDKLSIKEKYQRIISDLEKNYSKEHNKIFDIVRLSYSKK